MGKSSSAVVANVDHALKEHGRERAVNHRNEDQVRLAVEAVDLNPELTVYRDSV